tara:strand:+ start:439 stop:666 length:228 start_codon:yes stop_codon:yes gene_type:complete
MNDYVEWYLICGIAYAAVQEYEYRKTLDVDASDCWWFGEFVSLITLGAYNTAFWPKCIIDEMLVAYFYNDEDDEV